MPTTATAYLVVVAVPGLNPPNMPLLAGIPPQVGQIFPLRPVGNMLGREPTAATTIVLPWWHVSRRQTQIDFDGQSTWDVQDLSSRNGTYVNGQILQPLTPWPLCDGDHIHVAGPSGMEFLFTFYPATAEVPLPTPAQTYEEFLEEDEFR